MTMPPTLPIAVEAGACGPVAPGHWLSSWRIRNTGAAGLRLREVWLSHGKFRGPRQPLSHMPPVAPGAHARLELPVACDEPPAAEVENAFLILQLDAGAQPWRVLVRLRVRMDDHGVPHPTVELTTAQPIGFSG